MAAAASLKMLVTAVIEKIPCLISNQIMPALLTDKDPSENIYLAGWIAPGVPAGQLLHPVKLFLTDGSRAEVRVISSVPVIDAYGQLIMEHPPESGVTPVYTIGLTDIPDRGTLGSAPLIIIKSILQDGDLFRDQLQTLLIIHTQPERAAPGEDSAMLHLAVKYNVYPLPVQISLILCNGEFDIDIQPPTGGGGIVSLPSSMVFHSQ